MIKILIKHLIYAQCIEILFETIERNFSENKKSKADIQRDIIRQMLENQRIYTEALGANRVVHLPMAIPLIRRVFPPLFSLKKKINV